MDDLTAWGMASATAPQRQQMAERIVDQVWQTLRPQCVALLVGFLATPLGPQSVLKFEQALSTLVRELGRWVIQATFQALEPQDSQRLPRDLWWECGGYRRRNQPTPHRRVATWFGTITVWRRGYRSWDGDGSIFPLERLLGLTQGVTPALTDWIGREMAQAGVSQDRVLQTLREQHGVSLGVQRLRAVVADLAQGLAEHRQTHQVEALLAALHTAQSGRGSHRPVLAVGRDGITLREYRHRFFEVATTATVSVYDRTGRRLHTVYLACPPELGQATMSRLLTALLEELLTRWTGPVPQLAYITDAGDHESNYYQHTLRRMVHPRNGQPLDWQRVLDYYHVSQRVWTMAASLFGSGTPRAQQWALRMLTLLKQPSGARRVLQSASSHFHRRQLSRSAVKDFWKAYRYLQPRTGFLNYHQYQSRHLPIGSGVTEAACKTVFTQRLKLSGMRWSRAGARTILTLRVLRLSGTWPATFSSYLDSLTPTHLRPYAPHDQLASSHAA